LSIVRSTKQFQHYLLGREFTIRTDHSSLTWLLNFKDPQGQLARWLETLSQYNTVVTHRPGKKHINADALSRIPDKPPCKEMKPGMDISKLPCGGCKYCTKAHQNWTVFAQEIDDVVPLGMSTHSEQLSETTNVYAALSYLFIEEQEQYEDTDSSLLLHSSIDILCSAQEVSIEVETDASRKVYAASRTDGFAGIDYSVDEIRKFQEKDPDLELVLHFLRTNQRQSPSEEKLFISSKAAKKLWLNKEMFFLDGEGILRNISKKL